MIKKCTHLVVGTCDDCLREYGEEEFKRGCELFADGGYSHGNKEGYAQGFSDCRERAAKTTEAYAEKQYMSHQEEYSVLVEQIHALRAEGEKDTTPSEGGTK